jgi:hypothetical protein
MAQQEDINDHSDLIAHFLKHYLLPNYELTLKSYKKLSESYPPLIPSISPFATPKEWVSCGADKIIKFLILNKKIDESELNQY